MTTANKRLLLWDIDGTLITSGGGGDKSLRRAVQERFGVEDDLRDIEIAGRTDRHIARSILRKYSVEPTEENVREFL
ncbi:MAG: hydrolase, partial [Chthoniobacterales bacterium]